MINKLKEQQLPLMLSPFISQVGLTIYLLGLNWLIVDMTGTTKLLGIIQGICGVAFILADFLVGSLIDRYNPKKLIVLSCLLVAGINILGALLINDRSPQLWLLVLITFSLNMVVAINYPAVKTIIPRIIHRKKFQRFNALSNTIYSFANIVSPIISGFLLSTRQIKFSHFLLITGLLFLGTSGINCLINYQHSWQTAHDKQTFISATVSGLKYLLKSRHLRIFVVALGSYNFCYAGFLLLAPYIAKKHYAHQPGSYSVFLLIMAIGGITGGILLAHQKSEIQPIRIYQEQIAYGFLSLILYLTGGYYSWLLTALSFGFVQTRLLGSLPTFIQLSTRSEYLGRVFLD
ncbi:MFS transporter, partial [Lentilactobacillus kisonensis]|uniref:MFS transporter n=1 Tax=Lentilactobacillus kisonensis TaxID=481722 RepID=UPI001C65A490